jgi:abhydrolase domain-containing protein 6
LIVPAARSQFRTVRGEAPVLVMLHGYTGSKENWYRLCEALPRRYRLLAPDLPGWGESERVDGADYGFAAQAGRVAAFLDHVASGPVVLLGHSMGGGIAALVAARHPASVAKLALLDAAGVEFAENAFGRAVLDGDNPFSVDDAAALERYLSVLFHQRRARPPLPWPGSWAYVTHRRREAGFEQSVLERLGRSDERFLPWQEAAHIRQPTLLLWGAHDAAIDPSAMERYAQRIPQARRQLLRRSGHMTLMEEPRAVADAVMALIEEDAA